jgi:hypothetical protein
MPDDAAKGFGRSASLDTAGAEGAKPCATAASHRTHRSTTALALLVVLIHQPSPGCSLYTWGFGSQD